MNAQERKDAKRLAFRLQGLTSRGTPRKYKVWPRDLYRNCKTEREKDTARQGAVRQANMAAGLTGEGKPRKRKIWTELGNLHGHERDLARYRIYNANRSRERSITPLERAWRQVREQMGISFISWEDTGALRERGQI